MFCIGYYGYTTYSPATEIEKINISLSTRYDRDIIETGVIINGEIFNTSNTYEVFQIIKGENKIGNINIRNQDFYEEEYIINVNNNNRIDIELTKPRYPTVNYFGDPIVVEMSSNNFKNVSFCLEESLCYLFVEPLFNNETEYKLVNIEGFDNYENCYKTTYSLYPGVKKNITINYIEFQPPKEDDYINIILIDKDKNFKKYKIK